MSNSELHPIMRELYEVMDDVSTKIRKFQRVDCPHNHETIVQSNGIVNYPHFVKMKYKSDTGNWCKADDSYWTELYCPLCNKRWNLDHQRVSIRPAQK